MTDIKFEIEFKSKNNLPENYKADNLPKKDKEIDILYFHCEEINNKFEIRLKFSLKIYFKNQPSEINPNI